MGRILEKKIPARNRLYVEKNSQKELLDLKTFDGGRQGHHSSVLLRFAIPY
jgi:hypothetical protein